MKVTNAFSALRDTWMEPERQLVDCVCKIDHKLSKLSFIHPFMLKQQVNRKWLHCSKAQMMWFPFVVVVECVVGLPLANFSSGGWKCECIVLRLIRLFIMLGIFFSKHSSLVALLYGNCLIVILPFFPVVLHWNERGNFLCKFSEHSSQLEVFNDPIRCKISHCNLVLSVSIN